MTGGERGDGRIRFVDGLVSAGSRLDGGELRRRLDEQPVVLIVGRGTADRLEAQTTALTAVNLLGRLFRRLAIVAPEVDVDARLPFASGRLGPALAAFARRVHPDVLAELV